MEWVGLTLMLLNSFCGLSAFAALVLIAALHRRLDRIELTLARLTHLERRTIMTLAELQTKVQATADLETSAVTLIQGIAAQLAAAKTDPAAVQALADQLDAAAKPLADAIAANTLAAPGP